MRNLSTVGIILKKYNINEADQFITFYSADLGKIDALVKGSRKIDSSFTGHLEVLNICKFQLYKNKEKFIITQCQNLKVFKNIQKNLDKAVLGLMLVEIFQKSTGIEENDEKLFKLLESSIESLDQNNNNFLTLEGFKIKLLNLLGIMPDVTHCNFCSLRWINSSKILLTKDWHFICENCIKNSPKLKIESEDHRTAEIKLGIIKLLNFLKTAAPASTQKLKLKTAEKITLQTITNNLLKQYISRELKSESLLKAL